MPSRDAVLTLRIPTRGLGAPGEEVWCDPTGQASHATIRYVTVPPYAGLRVALPSGEDLGVSTSLDYLQCYGAGVQLWNGFEVVDAQRPLPEPVDRLVATVHAPSRATRGATLRFTVTLRNETDEPITLDPCPDYVEGLGGLRSEQHALNCAAAPIIGAHQSVDYAIQLRLGPRADYDDSLGWRLQRPDAKQQWSALYVA